MKKRGGKMRGHDERILILTSTQKDSISTRNLLEAHQFQTFICQTFTDLLAETSIGAGAMVLAKEVLISSNLHLLQDHLRQQESWSDLPIVILASAGDLTQGKQQTVQVLKALPSATILERPVRIATLTSVLESAIANRKRQYKVRDLLKELTEARQDAEQAKEESDRANRAKSEFLANMSHEIRTPLGVVLGFTDLAIAELNAPPEERMSFLSAIHRNGLQLLALVNDILDLAKVESGRIQTERLQISVLGLLNDVVNGLRPTAAGKEVEIDLQVAPNFEPEGETDPTRVRQILMNVLGNAIKFTKQGRITVHASTVRINDTTLKNFITVKDNGIGISDEQQAKLFQPFSQADSSMTREFGGTGLGLVLSRQLARALGGDLKLIASVPHVGSTFEISFEVGAVSSVRAAL